MKFDHYVDLFVFPAIPRFSSLDQNVINPLLPVQQVMQTDPGWSRAVIIAVTKGFRFSPAGRGGQGKSDRSNIIIS